jgi:hypothetical protein
MHGLGDPKLDELSHPRDRMVADGLEDCPLQLQALPLVLQGIEVDLEELQQLRSDGGTLYFCEVALEIVLLQQPV